MANLPGPYELEFHLSVSNATPVRLHVVRQNIALVGTPSPGGLFSSYTVQTRGGGTLALDVAANQMWSFFRLIYAAAMQVDECILWRYVTGTFSKDFMASFSVTNPTGATGSILAAQQTTLSYRTANGGIMKQIFLESNSSGDSRVALIANPAGNAAQRIAAYTMSADGISLGRDDSYPVSPLRWANGENEKIWRKIFRS